MFNMLINALRDVKTKLLNFQNKNGVKVTVTKGQICSGALYQKFEFNGTRSAIYVDFYQKVHTNLF